MDISKRKEQYRASGTQADLRERGIHIIFWPPFSPDLNPIDEAAVPPLDLYLNKRLVEFEQGLQSSGMVQLIKGTCTGIV